MKKETRSHKVNQYPVKRFIGPTVILIVLVAMFITGIYYVLNSYTTNIVTSYLSELAAHDEANIQAYVNDRFRLMRIICQELAAHQPDNVEDVLEELNLQARSHSVEAFFLIDQDNKLYSSRRVVHDISSNPFLRFFEDGDEEVVDRFDDASKYNENWKEFMFYGISFENAPLQLIEDGPVFTRMVMLRDTEYIRERMRITSFDGRGYTSIVDANGTFIVSDDSIASQGKFHSCFELIEGQPVWGIEREQILRKFRQGERFTFWYTDANGITKFVLFSPSESSDWTFLTSIEKSVYSDQIQQFVELVAFLMGGLFLIFLVVVFLFRITRNKLNAFYSGVVEGAHSRQYYDERVVDAPVTALAVVDVDHLKWINDSHGHLTGDEAIRKMATVLVKRTGSLGKVCRFGGDEFIVAIQQEITEEAFISMIDGIMEDVRAIRLKDSDIPMTLSIGAQYGSGNAGEVFVKADMLLYEAKKTRNRAVVSGREER